MDDAEATHFNNLFTLEFLATATFNKPQQSTDTRYADAVHIVRTEQGNQMEMEAKKGINTQASQAAWSSVMVFQKLR